MQYRSLGRTGVLVSVLTLGTMLFGNGTDAAQAADLVDRALDAGINALDTADVYGRGESERILGDLLRRGGRRDRIVLSSKGHVRMDDDDPNAVGSSRRHIIEACNASLRRLGTDHLDVYYLHRPDTRVPIDETLRALDDLTRAGKIRYVGTSSFAAWQILESLWAAKEHRLERPVAEQAPYSLLDRRAERELLPMARSYGIGITVWSPLAGGMLTGKYRRENAPSDSRLRPGEVDGWSERHFTEQAHTVVDTLVDLAKAKDATPAQIALAWTLTRPGISSLVLGARNLEQLDDQLGALTVELGPEDLAALDQASPPGRAIAPYYLDDSFADWGPHLYRW